MGPPAALRRATYDSEIMNSLPRRIPFTNNRSHTLPVDLTEALPVITSQLASTHISRPRPSLHSIIIGCNTYPSPDILNLRGAEPDAQLLKDYLMDVLQVPEKQITFLLGVDASRSNIVKAFLDLAGNEEVNEGDPIVIYYAGHGTEFEFYDGSTIQAIVPHDFCEGSTYVIPDHVLGRLIEGIAKEKGNNITVIFDCCSAGSGTRGSKANTIISTDPEAGALIRAVELGKGAYDPKVDEDIMYNASRSSSFCTKFRHGGMNSHTFIGACGASEKAKEINGHGLFSTAFFKLLRTISLDKLRYCDILTHMEHVPDQNPQCEGTHTHRLLFDGKVKPPRVQWHRIITNKSKNGSTAQFVLNAGSAHGITIGAKFAIYPSSRGDGGASAYATVQSVDAFTAVLCISRTTFITPSSYAVQIRSRNRQALEGSDGLRLYVPPEDEFLYMYKDLSKKGFHESHNFGNTTIVDGPNLAHLEVTWRGNYIYFSVVDRMATEHGFGHQNEVVADTKLIAIVLGKAARFYRAFNHTNVDSTLVDRIEVNFFQLEEAGYDELHYPIRIPKAPDLCRNMKIEFVVEEDEPYGVRIANNSEHDFYVYLYYFDVGALSIEAYHETSPSPYYRDPVLKRGSYCTIGYGSAGAVPISYYFRHADQQVDVGFLKLILSTKAIDLSGIPQKSPFCDTRRPVNWSDPYEHLVCAPNGWLHTWHTIVIPVIQRRRNSSA